MNIFTTFLFISSLFFFSACSKTITMKALEPAEVDRVAYTKKITVTHFKNDKVGLSNKVEANLASFSIDNKNYFTMVSRNDFDKIVQEQRIQNSGLVDVETATEIGHLIGAQAIISGNVASPTAQDSHFYEDRVRCKDLKCKELVFYNVRCTKRVVGLSAEVRITDVTRGDIIFADTLNKNATFKHCVDDSKALPSKEMAAQRLATTIAREFTYKLTPHYRHFDVTLLDSPDLDYSSKQEELLKVSLEYIEQERYSKAENLLKRLVDSTGSQSYVPFYDLGVLSEAKGKYKEAQEYYNYADNLMVQPVKEINDAVKRIERLILKRKKTREQINR